MFVDEFGPSVGLYSRDDGTLYEWPSPDIPNYVDSQRLIDNLMMANIWFTSDFHLGHFNIIRYCNRPFADTRTMNTAILERLNAAVKPDDILYFLGDFCMGGPKAVALYRDQIACKTIHFIDGNHDRTAQKVQQVFTSWSSLSESEVDKQGIVLCHYAMKVWPQHSRGTWQLYGHSHGNLPDDPLSLSMDVGVDSHDFRPWRFDEIQAIMQVKAEAKANRLQQGHREVLDNVKDLKKAEQMIQVYEDIMSGVPVIAGTRIPVATISEMLAQGANVEEILDGYPSLSAEQLRLACIYAEARTTR